MRFVDLVDGALELRWTWLPYWMSINPVLVKEVEEEIFDLVKLNGTTNSEEDLDAVHRKACKLLADRFPAFPGLFSYLVGLKCVSVD